MKTTFQDCSSARCPCVACAAAMPIGQPMIKIAMPRYNSLSANQSVSIFVINTKRKTPPIPLSTRPVRIIQKVSAIPEIPPPTAISAKPYLGMAIFIIGWPIGIAAAQATQGHLAELQSWNVVFISSAVLVLIAFSLMALFYLPPSEQSRSVSSPRGRLSHPEIGLVCIAGLIWMFLNGAYLVMLSFGPAQLIERGISIVGAGFVVSVMSWVFMFALPAGGYVATRYQVPNLMMVGGLAVSAVVGALIPYMPSPLLTFALFGIAFAAATPIIASLPAEVLEPRNRGPGFGVYWLWYFGGLPVLTALGGGLKDLTGTAAASVIFAAAMMLMCLLLLGVFRFLQSRWVLWPQGMEPR